LAVSAASCVVGGVTNGRFGGTRGGSGKGEELAGSQDQAAGRASLAHPRLIGDGSTAYTGPQPGQPTEPGATPLEPGEEPPQFVVFSWDGAAEDDLGLFSRFRELAATNDADMTYFLSGLYLLPEDERTRYQP